MKRNWKFIPLSAAIAIVAIVPNAFAQYGSGACAPACDVPTAFYAPTCDIPSCEPASNVPACDVPTCGTGYGYFDNYCYDGSFGSYGFNAQCFISEALNVAISPFKWVYCEFTDGIFPDCGCAPRPPKTACNPCTICGDYAGGCNDNCEAPACDPCANGYYPQNQNSYTPAYSADIYSSATYDVEQYDASPTRGSNAVPNLPINSNGQNKLSAMPRPRSFNFNIQDAVGNTRRAYNVSSVSYEQNAHIQNVRPVQAKAVVSVQRQRANVEQATPLAPIVQRGTQAQLFSNPQMISSQEETTENVVKSFGRSRPIR